MRVLVLPNISKKKSVHVESNFITFWQWAKAMPQHYWYLSVPKSAEIPKSMELDNLNYCRIEDSTDYNQQMSLVSQSIWEMFNPKNGLYPVDVIVTSRIPVGAMLKRTFTDTFSGRSLPILLVTSKANDFGMTHDVSFDLDLKLRSVAYSECKSYFLTSNERKIGINAARRYLTGRQVENVLQNGEIVCTGVDHQRVLDSVEGIKKNDNFTLYYGGRLTGNKRWNNVLDLYDNLMKLYADTNLVLTTTDEVKYVSDYKRTMGNRLTCHERPQQPTLFEIQAKCHASVCYIEKGCFARGYLEQILSGLIVVWIDRPWSRALFEGIEYPFFYKNLDEALLLLKWIKKNYSEAENKMKDVRDYIGNKLSLINTAMHVNKDLDVLVKDTYESTIPHIKDVKDIFDMMPDKFKFSTFAAALIKKNPVFSVALGTKYTLGGSPSKSGWISLGRRDFMRWLRERAEDLNNSPDPILRKK